LLPPEDELPELRDLWLDELDRARDPLDLLEEALRLPLLLPVVDRRDEPLLLLLLVVDPCDDPLLLLLLAVDPRDDPLPLLLLAVDPRDDPLLRLLPLVVRRDEPLLLPLLLLLLLLPVLLLLLLLPELLPRFAVEDRPRLDCEDPRRPELLDRARLPPPCCELLPAPSSCSSSPFPRSFFATPTAAGTATPIAAPATTFLPVDIPSFSSFSFSGAISTSLSLTGQLPP